MKSTLVLRIIPSFLIVNLTGNDLPFVEWSFLNKYTFRDVFYRNLLTDQFFYLLKVIFYGRIAKGNRVPFFKCPPGSSNPMYIIFSDDRNLKVDNVTHHTYVQAPSGYISRYKNSQTAFFKRGNRIYPGILPFVCMDYPYVLYPILPLQKRIYIIGYPTRSTKHDDPIERVEIVQ